jgi:hypothetical protein
MQVPAQRFPPPTAAATPVPAVPSRQPLTIGPIGVTRRVSASGLIGSATSRSQPADTSLAKS